jgi:hypothetical protein
MIVSDGLLRIDEANFMISWQHSPKGTGKDSQESWYLGCD